MKISKHSWHYKLVEWTYGDSYFYSVKGPKAVALCPYFWSTVLAILISPMVAIVKYASEIVILPKLSDSKLNNIGVIMRYTCGCFELSMGTISLLHRDYAFGTIMVSLGFFILFSVPIIKPIIDWHLDRQFEKRFTKPPKRIKEKKSNLLLEMIKARKSKICPLLEFVD